MAVLDLKAFMVRQQALALYRRCLRVASRAPEVARADLKAMARQEFRQAKDAWASEEKSGDRPNAKFMLAQGRARLAEIETMVNMVK